MKINNAFILRKIKEEFFLVPYMRNDVSEDIIFLNNVAGYIFTNAESCINKEILCDYTSELFGVTEDREAVESIARFIDEMILMRLIEE